MNITISLKVLLLLLLIHTSALAQTNLVPDAIERDALMALYDSTNGANWIQPWDVDDILSYPDSMLRGVEVENGDIVLIRLLAQNLTGTLPAQLNDLTQLVSLSFQYNYLNNPIPNLDDLQNLEVLNLGFNLFSGSIPVEVFNLLNLRALYLDSYKQDTLQFTGPIPGQIAQLTHLQTLTLANNNFSDSGSIPDSFSQLGYLQELDLRNCKLQSGSVNTGLGSLQNLETLTLDQNPSLVAQGNLSNVFDSLPNLTKLSLKLTNLQKFPGDFTALPKLSELDLSSNFSLYSDTLRDVVDSLKNILSLKTLALNNCNIQNLPTNFYELSSVEVLHLNSNSKLNPDSIGVLGALPSLTELYIEYCGLNTLPQDLQNSNTLRILNASNNNLSSVPKVLMGIPNLWELYLTKNGISMLPDWFGSPNMNTLKKLVLSDNSLSSLPDSISFLTNLTYLDISVNRLNGTWPSNFSALNNIKHLYLNNNSIDSLPDLTSWSELGHVRLQQNKLSGSVPAFLTNATSLKAEVDISFNDYRDVDSAGTFNGKYGLITIHQNGFTLEDILKLKPSFGSFSTHPQDSIDVERKAYAPIGGTLALIAHVDTAMALNGKYQWFKYVEGANDIPLFSTPSPQAKRYSITIDANDEGSMYYYKVFHNDVPDLSLTSRLISLVISCDVIPTKVDFSAKMYLCAVNFIPEIELPTGCKVTYYSWTYGDGDSSLEKSPFHAYSDGSYDVDMNIQFSCGNCLSDTTITKPFTFTTAQLSLKDSLISVTTDIKKEVIAVTASTFSDGWPLEHQQTISSGNPYERSSDGVWRNDATYVYDVPRKASASPDVRMDGTFDVEQFNWQYADINAIPNWTKANTMTRYSASGYELENQDVLGNYTAALYDYGDHLPSANGVNMQHKEMAFTSFEYATDLSSGNWSLGNGLIPRYSTYKVNIGFNHIAVVEAPIHDLQDVEQVEVVSRGMIVANFLRHNRYNFIRSNKIVCLQVHPENPNWTVVILRKSPYPYFWKGQIKVRNQVNPVVSPDTDNTVYHSGKSSMRVSSNKTFQQDLLLLDSAKSYSISAWVSVNDPNLATPELANNIGIEAVFKDKNGVVLSTHNFEPSGRIIEGWQQINQTFVHPGQNAKMELTFKPGSKGTAWYDDLRLHPTEGNMQSYVYDVRNFRLTAILDENNYASFYYYDEEGNLYLTKKETVEGVKTISETISYMREQETE